MPKCQHTALQRKDIVLPNRAAVHTPKKLLSNSTIASDRDHIQAMFTRRTCLLSPAALSDLSL